MGKAEDAFTAYIDTGAALSDSIKRNIQKDGMIDNQTVLALNEFIIAYNTLAELTKLMNMNTLKTKKGAAH